MSKPDLNYLRAEMSMAQSRGDEKAYVSVSEIMHVLHRLANLEREEKFKNERKMAGYINGAQLRAMTDGKTKTSTIRRRKNSTCTTALYYIDIVEPTEVSGQ
jgi:hypothetical protein